ncbi:MAG: hypothetical protein HYX28_05785 [Candidatus Koribacter versatilis]|uniref:Uncharacterized protein n=1 Tax=Candidatus Korobacter versatilis TaxID=658062 RepID=A0A932A822_9BACT|nr:hypothetical protein [Candidatus Koribacter versatilis]
MPAKTQSDVDVRLATIRKLIAELDKLRLVEGPAQQKKAEQLAGAIQREAALARARIRKLL